jgi:hypothetical protein
MFNDDQNASVSPVPVLLQYECMVSDRGSVFEITVFFEKDVFAESDGKHFERRVSVTFPMVGGRMYVSVRYGMIESA